MDNLHVSFYQRHPEYLDRLPERYRVELLAIAAGASWHDGNTLMIAQAAQIVWEEKVDEGWAWPTPPHFLSGVLTLILPMYCRY